MPPIIGLQVNQVTLLLGIGLFLLVLVNRIRRSFAPTQPSARYNSPSDDARRTATGAARNEMIGSARLRSATASKEQEAWEVEMHELARELKAEIDTKMLMLQHWIQLADEAQQRLSAAVQEADSVGSPDSLGALSRERNAAEERSVVPAGSAEMKTTAARSTRRTESGGWPLQGEDFAEDPRFERVYALADAGFSAAKIAGQIGSQIGEVELILSLRAQNQRDAM